MGPGNQLLSKTPDLFCVGLGKKCASVLRDVLLPKNSIEIVRRLFLPRPGKEPGRFRVIGGAVVFARKFAADDISGGNGGEDVGGSNGIPVLGALPVSGEFEVTASSRQARSKIRVCRLDCFVLTRPSHRSTP